MRFRIVTLALFLIIIVAKASFAAVEGSPHDMIAQEFFAKDQLTERSNCSYCHLSFEDEGEKIWKQMPTSMDGFGQISPFCYSCHDGVTIVDINVDASRTAFSEKSHAFFQRRILDGESKLNVSLAYLEGKPLDCTTCHNPHNNDNRPFLVLPFEELCLQCHVTRRNSGFGQKNAESNHPVFVPPSDATEGPSPIHISPIFNTGFPMPYPIIGGKFSEGTHWDLGGHLSAGKVGNITCYTCHTVHGDELEGPNDHLQAIDPVREINDAFCEGCHRGKRSDDISSETVFPNPGATIEPRTYHPADDDTSNGFGHIVEINMPEGWPFGKGFEKNVLCSTCHDAHNALPYSPILRTPKEDTFCEECHDEEIEGHHSSGKESNPRNVTFATKDLKWSYEIETQWENGNPEIKFEADIEGGSTGYGVTYGKKVENKIYCSSCHRAHNAGRGVEKKAAPSLIVAHTANQLCFMCHFKENISFNEDLDMRASHFLGDPSREDTYEKPLDEMILYEEEWPETKIKSKYGGDNQREVICESCHSFSEKNLNAKEYGYEYNNKAMLVARADEKTEWIPGTSNVEVEEEDSDYFDDLEEEESDEGAPKTEDTITADGYLCVGCHGERPGGGASHQMMGCDGIMPNGEKINRKIDVYPASYTKNLNLNCLSCHFVHRGKNNSGVYMLKEATRDNTDPLAIHPDIDFSPLCAFCHIDQY